MKPCPVNGCGGLIRAAVLCCHAHWRLLPDDLRGDLSWLLVNMHGSFEHDRAKIEALSYLNALPHRVRLYA